MWPRRVFEIVGTFDVELVRNQDDEHAYRVRRAGGLIWYDPRMVVHYKPRPSVEAIFEQYRQYGFWKVRVFQKHPGAARWRHFVPSAWLLALAALGVLAPWSRTARRFLVLSLSIYTAALGTEGWRHRQETSPWRVGIAIAAVHAGYGYGFLQGIRRFGVPFRRAASEGSPADPPALSSPARDQALAEIKAAYAEYETSGRTARWRSPRPGDVASLRGRDAVLVGIARARRPAVVMDLGCGDANVARTLDAAGVRPAVYLGIDLLPERLARARALVPWGTFVEASADRLPHEDASVDLAVAFTLLSSIPAKELRSAVLREVSRVVRPGGALLIYDIRVPSPGNRHLRRVSVNEIREAFPGWNVSSRSLTVLPPLARSAIGSSNAGYRLMHGIPMLRSHNAIIATRP